MPFGAKWPNVEIVRGSILSILATVFHDHEFCRLIGIVVGELLENAVAYGDWCQPGRALFRLGVNGDTDRVQIRVSNPYDPTKPNIEHLCTTIEVLRRENIGDLYSKRILELADEDGTKSRLGLLRCAYELGTPLSVELNTDKQIVTVCAEVKA
jgi:hypothetical protein